MLDNGQLYRWDCAAGRMCDHGPYTTVGRETTPVRVTHDCMHAHIRLVTLEIIAVHTILSFAVVSSRCHWLVFQVICFIINVFLFFARL